MYLKSYNILKLGFFDSFLDLNITNLISENKFYYNLILSFFVFNNL